MIELAKKIFFEKFPQYQTNVIKINQIHAGYTNYSFLFVLNNGLKYQVRIPNDNKIVNRQIEFNILELLENHDFVYFDVKTGIAIKKWIEGYQPTLKHAKSYFFRKKLFKQIFIIHQLPSNSFNKFKKINFDFYHENLNKLPLDIKNKYIEVLKHHENDDVVINHSDINLANIVMDYKKKLHLIDFEWTALASDYWDYANFFREHDLPLKKGKILKKFIHNFKFSSFIDYVFLSACFAYLWTFKMQPTTKILQYRQQQLDMSKKYFNCLTKTKI